MVRNTKLAHSLLSLSFIPLFLFSNWTGSNGWFEARQVDEPASLESPAGRDGPVRILSETTQSIVLEFSAPEPQFEEAILDGQACQKVSIPGLSNLDAPGQPGIPAQGAMLGIPQDSVPVIQVLEEKAAVLSGRFQLCPSPKPILSASVDSPWEIREYSYHKAPIYQQAGFTPETSAELVSTGRIRSQRYAEVRFNPLQYNPLSGELRYVKYIRLELKINSRSFRLNTLNQIASSEPGFEEMLKKTLLNYEQARRWRIVSSASQKLETFPVDDPPMYKILVDQEGIYRLKYADLQTAGIPVEFADTATYQLFNQSTEISLYLDLGADGIWNSDDEVVFYGSRYDSKYTAANAYWFTWGQNAGSRMAVEDGTPSGVAEVPTEYFATQHAEVNEEYILSSPSGPENDHWYWKSIYASSAPAFQDFSTSINHLGAGGQPVSIRGLVKGYAAESNHHTRIYLNNDLYPDPVDDHTFAPESDYLFDVSLPAAYLKEGANTLRVECPRDNGVSYDQVYMNWFEIEYYRSFFAEDNRLFFSFAEEGSWEFQADGFSSTDFEVYDLTDPGHPVRIEGWNPSGTLNGQMVAFEAEISGKHNYLAQLKNKRLDPLSFTLDNPSSWKSTSLGADYIIITHQDFIDQVEPLADLRLSQGLRVQVVDVEDLYDEFNGGVFSPEAIRDFLKYAYDNWEPPAPRYVLLVGDGHLDFLNYWKLNVPIYIPPYLDDVDPWVGEIPADNRYASIAGDDILPDIYIGRFPVNSPAEAQVMVEKTINYETNPPQRGWNKQLTFVTDNPDEGGNYPLMSDQIISANISDPYQLTRIYYGENYSTISSARTALINAFNQGSLIVHYSGHGAVPFWGDGLFQTSNLSSLSNGSKLPFVVPMTCSEGYFTWPKPPKGIPGMGESIVRIAGAGAIASWSPTGWGMSDGHMLLDDSLFNDLFNQNSSQLGYLTTQAKYSLYANSSGNHELIENYILFGDPALKLWILPAAPSDLQADTVSMTQINIAWHDNSMDEDGFRVERSLNGSSGWQEIAELNADVTSYNDTGLEVDTLYYYRIRAHRPSDDQFSVYSQMASSRTLSQLSAPGNLQAAAVSTTQINLSWQDSSADETELRIERSPDGIQGWEQIAVVNADVTSYSDTGLDIDAPYYYRVLSYRSIDGYISPYSSTAYARTWKLLAAPGDLQAAQYSCVQIDLTWQDTTSDETGFKLERLAGGDVLWEQIAVVDANTTGYRDSGLRLFQPYSYRVSAFRIGDDAVSNYSNIVSITIDNCRQTFFPLISAIDSDS